MILRYKASLSPAEDTPDPNDTEHDLLREMVGSGIAAAKARGQEFGRRKGHRPSDKHAPEVICLSEEERLSQRAIAERLGISKTTVNEILKRNGAGSP